MKGPRQRVWSGQVLLVVATLAVAFLRPAGSWAQLPWEGEPFSASPAAILEGVRTAVPAGETGTVVLLEEERVVLDLESRLTRTTRTLYRIGAAGPGARGYFEAAWQPWLAERPEVRARVLTPDGRELGLDPRTVSEASSVTIDGITFSDTRVLSAPLPGLSPGAVVEVQIVVRGFEPAFGGGATWSFPVGAYDAPVLRTLYSVEAPEELPLKYVTRLVPGVEPVRSLSGGRVRLDFDIPRIERWQEPNPFLAPELPMVPYLGFSTAVSWESVGRAYADLMDRQIAASDIGDVVELWTEGAATREEIVSALLDRVQREIRYTAVQLGDAAIVPNTPRETLELGYGDCKDQATLLIAMLREAGVEAYIALLNVGSGFDTEPDLPGLEAFDHTIVYIPGAAPDGEPIWIDSTAGFSRAGQIPAADQGHRALIARPGTYALERVPEQVGRIVETREVFLPEDGFGRVVETTQLLGPPEITFRAIYAAVEESALRQNLAEYARQIYGAEVLGETDMGAPRDFDRSFGISFEADEARFLVTAGGESAAFLVLTPILTELAIAARLYDQWRQGPAGPADGMSPEAEFVAVEAVVREWRYRIVPPPGYRLDQLPETRTDDLGAAVLSREFTETPDGVEGLIRLDVPRRFTGEEAAGLLSAMNTLPVVLTVSFRSAGQTHLDAGEIREALGAFRELAALHPDEALHGMQVARALIGGGMGATARAEAERAVAMEPDSAATHATLAFVLQHDLVGRLRAPGADFAGAVRSFERALELEPDNGEIRADLAILLEYTPLGIRYGSGADLDRAIAEYRRALGNLPEDTSIKGNLAGALMRAGRFAELREDAVTDGQYLVAVAIGDGVGAVGTEAARRVPSLSLRQTALREAANELMQLRRYPEAGELYRLAGGASVPAGIDAAGQLASTRRYEDLSFPDDEPESIAARTLIALALRQEEAILGLLSESMRGMSPGEVSGMLESMYITLVGTDTANETFLDLMLTRIEPLGSGNDAVGYRMQVSAPAFGRIYLTPEAGSYRIAAFDRHPETIGLEVLDRVDAGDLPGARQWLDWALDELGGRLRFDALAAPVFDEFWNPRSDVSQEAMRYAGASLLVSGPFADRAVPILAEGLERATSPADMAPFARALSEALSTLGRHTEALVLTEAVPPGSDELAMVRARVLAALGRRQEAIEVIETQFGAAPTHASALRELARISALDGQYARANLLFDSLAGQGEATAEDVEHRAWFGLFDRDATDAPVDTDLPATFPPDVARLRAAALLLAEAGRGGEARDLIVRAMNSRVDREPDAGDWYVLGRIYEQFGETAAAVSTYQRIEPPGEDDLAGTAAFRLSRRRLGLIAAP
jgi:tetratricopeptide (TPR) repeat protein